MGIGTSSCCVWPDFLSRMFSTQSAPLTNVATFNTASAEHVQRLIESVEEAIRKVHDEVSKGTRSPDEGRYADERLRAACTDLRSIVAALTSSYRATSVPTGLPGTTTASASRMVPAAQLSQASAISNEQSSQLAQNLMAHVPGIQEQADAYQLQQQLSVQNPPLPYQSCTNDNRQTLMPAAGNTVYTPPALVPVASASQASSAMPQFVVPPKSGVTVPPTFPPPRPGSHAASVDEPAPEHQAPLPRYQPVHQTMPQFKVPARAPSGAASSTAFTAPSTPGQVALRVDSAPGSYSAPGVLPDPGINTVGQFSMPPTSVLASVPPQQPQAAQLGQAVPSMAQGTTGQGPTASLEEMNALMRKAQGLQSDMQ